MRVMPNENITMTTNNRTKAIQTGIILLTVDITKYTLGTEMFGVIGHFT